MFESSTDQRGDTELKLKVYQDMDAHYPFLDCSDFPSEVMREYRNEAMMKP